jgi:SAM-dependent methyltransferase
VKKKGLEEEAREYWKLSEYDERVQDQSHWLGSARWDRDRWLAYGDFHGSLVNRFLREHAPVDYTGSLGEKAALDWGCGGGANLRALCGIFGRATGVDVSGATVAQCEKQLGLLGCENFETFCFTADRPEQVLERLGRATFDFVFSAAVFQHFPSRDYSRRVLEVMEKLMRPGACGLIQVRYDDGSDKLRQKESDYSKNVIYMTSFKTGEFADQLKKAGLTLLASERDLDNPEDRHEYCFFRR